MLNQVLSFEKVVHFVDETSKELLIKDYPSTLYNPINYLFLKKGKKTRSLLACLVYDLFGGDIKNIKQLILAIESLHLFTLIHDDVMDNAKLRRGYPTINEKWSSNQAILSGDALMISAYNHLLNLKNSNKKLLKIFTKTALQICQGQQLDLDMQIEKFFSLDEYLTMIDLKTGALIKFALVSAASLNKVAESDIIILEKLGFYLGELFQIQDDYLDLYGLELETGKSIGGDVFESKKTFLYITALGICNNEETKKFIKLYHDKNENKLSRVQSFYADLGIKEIVENKIKTLNSIILDLVAKINIESNRKKVFIDFVNMISNRKR